MVNSQDSARPLAEKAARQLTTAANDPCASRKNIFDGTKLPLERSRPKTTTNCVFLPFPADPPVHDCAAATRNTGVMHRFWATFSTIGDKIKLPVTILTREYRHHGR
jgi:hypothetical protein